MAVIETRKPHLSASQLESYCRCPEAYRRRYLDGDIIPPGIAMLKGTGFHAGAKANFSQKIETHRDLPAEDIVAAAVADFETQTKGSVSFTDDEIGRGVQNVIGEATDDLSAMARAHAEQQAPDYQPRMVEQSIRIELPNAPRDLLAIIDLADDYNRIVDFKTAGKSKSQSDADTSVQLTVYAAAFEHETGESPSEVRLDTIVRTTKATKRQVLSSSRDGNDFSALARRMNVVTSAIAAGSFPPATPGAWWCGPKWCGYFHTCPYVNSERKALAESEG